MDTCIGLLELLYESNPAVGSEMQNSHVWLPTGAQGRGWERARDAVTSAASHLQPGLNPLSAIRESRDSPLLEISSSVLLRCSVLLAEQTSSVLLQHPANLLQSLTGHQGWAMGLEMRGWSLLLVDFCHSGW